MLTFKSYLFQNESNDTDFAKRLLAGGKFDILMFTIGHNDWENAMRMKSYLRKIGIDNYEYLNSYEMFDPDREVYVIFTKKSEDHKPFYLMNFGSCGIYPFFKDVYPMFNNPSPIFEPEEFIEYVEKTVYMSARLMYAPKKTYRDI